MPALGHFCYNHPKQLAKFLVWTGPDPEDAKVQSWPPRVLPPALQVPFSETSAINMRPESRARRVLVKLSSIRDGAKKQRGNQSGRAGQVVLVCAQPLALTGRNGEADLDQDSRPQPLCAKGTDVAHILMDIMSSYLWTLQSKR